MEKTIQLVVLTPEQSEDNYRVIKENIHECTIYFYRVLDEWWKNILGWKPYKVECQGNNAFMVYPDPK